MKRTRRKCPFCRWRWAVKCHGWRLCKACFLLPRARAEFPADEKPQAAWTPKAIRGVLALVEIGWGYARVAEHVGRSHGSVRLMIQRLRAAAASQTGFNGAILEMATRILPGVKMGPKRHARGLSGRS